jgi:hypothetical protein
MFIVHRLSFLTGSQSRKGLMLDVHAEGLGERVLMKPMET